MSHNSFDSRAADWDKKESRKNLASAVARALDSLPLTSEMEAMDFGCGTGLVGLEIAPRLRSLVAFDSSAGMVETLKDKISTEQLKNVTPVHGDILTAGFDRQFDLIFSSMTMHHITRLEPVLAKLHQILKKDGLLAIADLDAEDGSFHSPGAEEKHHGFDRRIFAEKLEKLGFSAPVFETVHTISKKTPSGALQDFTVFLAVSRKKS